jgi:HdeA/HdeB family
MAHRLVLAVIIIALNAVCLSAVSRAQDNSIPCDAFVKNPDGSWSAMRNAAIQGTGLTIRAGSVLRPGASIRGLDLATMLNRACPEQPEPAPVATSDPWAALGRYADANGNIEVERLTCAQLADASSADADLLLAWYSGWYNGLAKRHSVNPARVGYAIRNVADFCKGNRDKRLAEVMALMLK